MYSEGTARREFGSDFDLAIAEWGKLRSEPAALKKAVEIVENVKEKLGEIVLVYKVSSDQYVAIKFANEARAGVFINVGFVDHRVELPNSHYRPEHDIWRTNLPTSTGQKVSGKKPQEIVHETCSTCFLQYPKHLASCPSCSQQD